MGRALGRRLAGSLLAGSLGVAAALCACSGAGLMVFEAGTGDASGGGGDDATAGADGKAIEGGSSSGGGSSSSGGVRACGITCNTDQDCVNACPAPMQWMHVWCCGSGTCYDWSMSPCPASTSGSGSSSGGGSSSSSSSSSGGASSSGGGRDGGRDAGRG